MHASQTTLISHLPDVRHHRSAALTPPSPPSVHALVNYVKPPASGDELYVYVGERPEHLKHHTNLVHEPTRVEVTNLRHVEQHFTLERNGFQLADFRIPAGIDWTNNKQVRTAVLLTGHCALTGAGLL